MKQEINRLRKVIEEMSKKKSTMIETNSRNRNKGPALGIVDRLNQSMRMP
jgi:hypothetical protein